MIEKGLSRKDFLKAGGIAIAGAALFGAAGGARSDGRIVRIQLDEGAGGEVRALDVEGEPGLFVVQEGPMEGQELFVCSADELEAPRGRRAQACPTLTCRHRGPGRLKPVGRGARKTSDGQIVERNWFEWELLLKDSNAWRPMEGLIGYERQTRWLEWVFHHSLGLTAYGVWINVREPGVLASYDSTFQWLPWEGYRCGGTTNALGCTGNGGAAPGRGTIWTTMRTGEVEALTFEEQKMSRYHKGPLHEMEHAIEGFNHGQLLVAGYEEEGAGTLMGCSPPACGLARVTSTEVGSSSAGRHCTDEHHTEHREPPQRGRLLRQQQPGRGQARRPRRCPGVRQRRADEPPVQDARARARAAKLEAADVRELGRLNYRFLIQRRTGGIDIKNGKRVPWVDRRFHVTNEALKQNKKTPRRRSNQRIRLRRIQYRRSSWNFPF